MALPFQLALGNNTPTTVNTEQGRIQMSSPQFLDISGGINGYVMTTDGSANLSWAAITPTGPDAPANGTTYGRKDAGWARTVALAGDSMTGPLVLSGDPTLALHAATKQYVDLRPVDAPNDGSAYGRQSAAWVKVLPLAGGTLLGMLTLSAGPTLGMHAATKQYVDARASVVSVTISDVPPVSAQGVVWWNSADGQLYVFYDGQWVAATSTPGVVR
jgi:hypothetical protein